MSVSDRIMDIFDEELNERLVSMMNEYIDIISKKHGISMDLLLKDIPETFSGTICKGTKVDGRRCTFRGIHSGYCRHHAAQASQPFGCALFARLSKRASYPPRTLRLGPVMIRVNDPKFAGGAHP